MWEWKPSEGIEQEQHGHINRKGRSPQQQDFGQTKDKGEESQSRAMQETTNI